MKLNHTMKNAALRAGLRHLATIVLLGFVVASMPRGASANDVNVAPSACSAPFLDQAFPMYFNENYVMNPSDNIATWVICGLIFDNDQFSPNGLSSVAVTGSEMSGASQESPQCFFTVHSLLNTTQNPYRFGDTRIYTISLPLTSNSPDLWVAESTINFSQIAAAVGSDPDLWMATAWCRLPSGHSLSGVLLGND